MAGFGYIRILEGTTPMAWRSKRKVMHAYDVTAEMYDERYSEEQERKYRKALENVDAAEAAVLDVGCGSGLFFSQVASKAEIVVGVDVSFKLLKKAKEQAKAVGNVFVLQADADHLPFREGVFGGVFAFTMLQNMPKPAQTLLELRRATKCSGKIVVTGLKKAFRLEEFMDLLEGSGMTISAFVDEEAINCYVATLTA
jgi:ubiquinone/menaquinone biosynthesis C-methylase UbiE